MSILYDMLSRNVFSALMEIYIKAAITKKSLGRFLINLKTVIIRVNKDTWEYWYKRSEIS